VTMPASQ